MKLDYQLKLEQSQKLIITPELKLAISLLQYSAVDLLDYVQEKLLENPVLEIREGEEKEREEFKEKEIESVPEDDDHEFPWEEYFRDTGFDASELPHTAREQFYSVENCAVTENSMMEDLLAQLRMMTLLPEEYSMAAFLVGNLDSNGYLQGELEDLALALGVTAAELEAVLHIVQSLEPTGIGSRNLQECLTLQLMSMENPSPLALEIVKHYLPAAADGRFRYIAGRLNCDLKDVREAVQLIRTLNPKPGSIYGGGTETRYILPDIVVEKVGREYVVIVNDGYTPHLTINPYYQKLLQGHADEQLYSFIKNKMDSALWLIRSIEQRRLTLYRVAEQLVEIQRAFLDEGIKQLKPLTLKEVAQRIGVHESTVSRATTNKYMQTPRGLFPLKFFFSSGLVGEDGEDYSSISIKSYLKEIISDEDPQKPYSDQQLTDILLEKGIVISRRTVAKYREEINIPPSHRRRRLQ